MRSLAFVLVTQIVACGSSVRPGDLPDAGPDGGAPTHGFQIVSPNVDINPGAEITYCYYFRTPNTSDLVIQRWASHMTAAAHDVIMYLTPGDLQTPGTLSTSDCGISSLPTGVAVWAYAAQTPDAEVTLPADDGEGYPVGQRVSAGRAGFLQMHYLNTTGAVIHAHVEINAYAYADNLDVTPAAPFVAYYLGIDLPPAGPTTPTSGMVSGACDVLPDNGKVPRFFSMTTHTHKQSTHTFVKDGDPVNGTTIFDSTDWEHPGTTSWGTPSFYTFASGKLGYQCEYVNQNDYRIQTGDSAATDELCMAIGFYFPSLDGRGQYCLNSANIPN